MKQAIKLGRADFTVLVFIPDPASTDGSGKTGLAHTDMTVSYTRVETDNDVTVTDATSSLNALTNLTDAHNDWGWKEVSSTLAPGLYRLDLADAVLASGIWSAVVYVMVTTSAAAASPMEFVAVAYDPLDTVRLGLTALPNAAADAAGGLIISDAGGLDADAQRTDVAAILVDTSTTLDDLIDTEIGTIITDIAAVKSDTAAILADTGTDGVIVASIAANAVSASALATDAVSEIADGILNRDMSTGTDSGSASVRTMRQALRFLRNKWSISGTTLTVTKEDDTTASWTSEVTGTAGADPITASDPAS